MKDIQKIELEQLENVLAIYSKYGKCTKELQQLIDRKYMEYADYLWDNLPKSEYKFESNRTNKNLLGRVGMEYP